jgi:HAD superfamily hydrolase (TIGR01509 family)
MVLNTDLQRDSFSILPHGLEALIFDMDGVLCDTMPYHLEAWVRYVKQVPQLAGITRESLSRMGGKRNSELLVVLLPEPCAEEDLQRWGSEKEALYRGLIQNEIQWVPGLVPFLERSRAAGLKLGVGTSACRENVELLLNHENLGRFFPTRVVETDVQRGKPDPQCYLLVAERLEVDPADCLVFEDAIAGVQAARAAGMRCWGILTLHSDAELRAAGAEHCMRDFTRLVLPQTFS